MFATAPDPDPITPAIAAIADHLIAGHDLLQTHFSSDIEGKRVAASRWSAVVTSPPFTTALLQEISNQAEQLWHLAGGLCYAITGTSALYGTAPAELDHAARWLELAQVFLDQVPANGRDAFPGRYLLHVLPANQVPPPQPPAAPETVSGLCQGITGSAERLHAVAFTSRGYAAWSPVFTSWSWTWTARARAITAELTEIVLRSLAERIQDLPSAPHAWRMLTAAAEAAANTCERWRHVTAAWGHLTTDTTGLTGPGVTDSGDLLIRVGRLAFDSQDWTPAKDRRAPVRDPASLAPGPDQFAAVFTAVHHAADALASTASADEHNIVAAAAARRIYLPTRLLSDDYDIPRRYGPAPPADIRVLLKTYAIAATASSELAVALDPAALALGTPSQTITAARIATRPGQETIQAGQSPLLNPGWRELALSRDRPQGPVEQRLRQLHIDNPVLLVRAKAIDTASRALTTEAKASRQTNPSSSAAAIRRNKGANSRQITAAQNFPPGAGQPAASRPSIGNSRAPRGESARRPRQPRP